MWQDSSTQVIMESNHLKVLVFKCRSMFLPIIHVRSGEFWAHQAIQKPPRISLKKSWGIDSQEHLPGTGPMQLNLFVVTIPAQLDMIHTFPKAFVSPKFSNSEFLSAHFGRVDFFSGNSAIAECGTCPISFLPYEHYRGDHQPASWTNLIVQDPLPPGQGWLEYQILQNDDWIHCYQVK